MAKRKMPLPPLPILMNPANPANPVKLCETLMSRDHCVHFPKRIDLPIEALQLMEEICGPFVLKRCLWVTVLI
jgi:hypothetical protein